MVILGIKVSKRRVHLETSEVERDKPHERETQNLVGESLETNNEGTKGEVTLDKCLPPRNRYRTWLIRYFIYYKN